MSHSPLSRYSVLLSTALFAPWANAATLQADRVFASGFSQALVIEGSAGYPGPLANARVEAHFGEVVAVATTAIDGTYRIGLELDQIDPTAIVELFARGSGSQSHLVWASPLGPANRLLTLAGSSHRIGFAEDPFVYLSPRSTVAAAAARAFNDWQPITDAATFWRAVRGRQPASDDLVFALALVARDALALPNGSTDTFEAASTRASSQALRVAYQDLDHTDSCWIAPGSAYCDVRTNLPLDAQMFPSIDWVIGEKYSEVRPFYSFASDTSTIIPTESGAMVWWDAAIPATVTRLPEGGYELAPADGGVFWSFPTWDFVGGVRMTSRREVSRIYFRPSLGPGGQIELVRAVDSRTVFPDNPEVPDWYRPYDPARLPVVSASNPLPAELVGPLPSLAGHSHVLISPLPQPSDASIDTSSHGYDVHAFGTHDGSARRSGRPFTFQMTGVDTFSIDSDGRHAEYRFFNEEEPGVWRIRMQATHNGRHQTIDGLLVPADAEALTAAGVVGTWNSRFDQDRCGGPYGDPNECSPPLFFTFLADGSAMTSRNGQPLPGNWSLGSGNDAGRLVFEWLYPKTPPLLIERRAWEVVHESGNRRWVLENYNYFDDDMVVAPIVFNPTGRLIRYDRE